MELAPLGIGLLVEAGEPELLSAVTAACEGWEGPVDETTKPLRLGLALDPRKAGADAPAIAVQGQRLEIGGAGVGAWADAALGRAECAVSRDFLDGCRLGEEVFDALILFLLTRSGRTPIHAAGFVVGDLAVLLAGPSGSGKSCLAHAAQEAGLDILSDDTVYLQLKPKLRIWGVPRPIHLFPEDAPPGQSTVRIRSGKLKMTAPAQARANPRP